MRAALRRAGYIVVPYGNSVEKNAAMRAFGARLIEHGTDFEAARDEATASPRPRGWNSRRPSRRPGDGVATYALECSARAELDALYVPIGLGSGICGAIRRATVDCDEIIGVQAPAPIRMRARSPRAIWWR